MRRPLPFQPSCPVCGDPTVFRHALGIRFQVEPTSGEVLSFFRLESTTLGFPGRVHGGLVSMIMDEAMAWACAVALQTFCTTGELRVKLKQPVPHEKDLAVVARVVEAWGKYARARADLTTPEGTCLAMTSGSFAALPREASLSMYGALSLPPGCYNVLFPTSEI